MSDLVFGALKDPVDTRDYPFVESKIAKAAVSTTIPESVDWSVYTGPTKSQGNIGSCAACAAASAREFLLRTLDNNSKSQFSALYLYYRTRQIMGTLPQDSGSYLRDVMKALNYYGIPDDVSWPYDVAKFNDMPILVVDTSARWRRIYSYYRIDVLSVDQMRMSLAEGHPFVMSMNVFGNFFIHMRLNNNYVLEMPSISDSSLGGHAVFVVGYSDAAQVFHVQNSWGEGYGQRGMFWIPYEYITKFAWDAWVMVA